MFRLFKSSLVAGLSSLAVLAGSSQALAIGGSDVGGGGTIDLPLASMDQIAGAVDQSKTILKLWLNGEETLARTHKIGSLAITRIFGLSYDDPENHPNIYKVFADLKIEFRRGGPCYDKEGNPHDGSIYTNLGPGHAICISGLSLSQKLRQDDFDFQTAALILHEASHLLETTEAEAQELQARVVRGIRLVDFSDSKTDIYHFSAEYQLADSSVARLIALAKRSTSVRSSDIHKAVVNLFNEYEMAHSYLNRHGEDKGSDIYLLSPLRPIPMDQVWSLFAQLINLEYATCTNRDYEPCEKIYDGIFNGARLLYARSFQDNVTHVIGPTAPAWPTRGNFIDDAIPRIDNPAQFIQVLNDFRAKNKALLEEVQPMIGHEKFTVLDDGSPASK